MTSFKTLCLRFEFPARRYHATPWGHHVNEGLVEWPPSPWRMVRALLATGYSKLGWTQVPDEMRRLVEALAASEPTYRLPRATEAHTRHFMPVKGLKKGVQATSLVIDAFVCPEGALGVEWPAEVTSAQRDLLANLLGRIGYLGRAESRVKARLVQEGDLPNGMLITTHHRALDDEPVRLLAPVANPEYETWRRGVSGAPENLLAALHMETSELQSEGWSAPPGSREMVYWRPADAFSLAPQRVDLHRREAARVDTALFALATDRKRDVLPLMERALPTMAGFRRALLSNLLDDQQRVGCPELSGRDESGRPLQSQHRHAHFIPLCLNAGEPERIDHILVHAPIGFGALAQRALRLLRGTWVKGIDDVSATLVGIGGRASFLRVGGRAIAQLGRSATWESQTPFIPPRFVKTNGKSSLEGQVDVELGQRGLPRLASPLVVTLPTDDNDAGRRARWFRHFNRARVNAGAPQPPPGVFHLTLNLESPIEGPLCLGWGCHFGLGMFLPLAGC